MMHNADKIISEQDEASRKAVELNHLLNRERHIDLLHAGEDPLLEGLLFLCEFHDRPTSSSQLTAGLPLDEQGRMQFALVERAMARVNLDGTVRYGQKLERIPKEFFPVLIEIDDGSVAVLKKRAGHSCIIVQPQLAAKEISISLDELVARHTGVVVFCMMAERKSADEAYLQIGGKKHWFWSEVAKFKWQFIEIAGAAALVNTLALATALFSRQVFDRVIPNQAIATLWVLVIGVMIAVVLELVVRTIRAYLVDAAGKRIDLELSARVFERAISIQLASRPKSTGSFINQVRECDSVREFFTSTTIATISDLPFVILFIAVIWMIAGPMAYVQIAAIPLIVIPGLLAQFSLRKASRHHMKESAIRNGLLVDAMTGIETVKVLRAEGRFQRIWEEYTVLLARNSTHMRAITNTLSYLASSVQQIAYVMLMVVGVYLAATGELTTGGLLACSILSSRAIGPLTQIAGILGRWQQMKVALSGLDIIMEMPVDRTSDFQFVHRPRLEGGYRIESLAFQYEKGGDAAVSITALDLPGGSSTAILGPNGSGKSTLLKLFSGLYHSNEGRILVDGTDIRQIDPDDVRRQVVYLTQDVRLFHGSLRENLLLGIGQRPDEELMEALAFVGAEGLASEHQEGLDRKIGEGGIGVSGGQRQSIGLARVWLRDPRVVLLDEPTAAMDHALEMKVIANLLPWIAGRTVIIATHRQPILQLVKNAIVMNKGQIVQSGSLEEVLAVLSNKKPAAVMSVVEKAS